MLIINGQLFEPGAPEVTLLNRSFHYGDGLFESIRIYNGKPLFLEDHLRRLTEGMDYLRFQFEADKWKAILKEEISRCIVVNQIAAQGRLRLHIYRAGPGAYTPLENKPYYLIEGYSLKTDYFNSEVGISLTDFPEPLIYHTPLSAFKTANALSYVLAGLHAQREGYDEALLSGKNGIAEASSANLFIVHQQKLITPPLNSGCLPGIMRKKIIMLAEKLKIPFLVRKVRSKDLLQADEIFLTNAIRGIIPVHKYNAIVYNPSHFAMIPFLRQCLRQYIRELG